MRRKREVFNRAISLGVDGWPRDIVFNADRTAFVKLPVITAVEGTTGKASRSNAD
jgi:hypothetical protein